MKTKVYSIYDRTAQVFNTPFFQHNDGMAIRAFQDNVNSQDSVINKHPEQFSLHCLGEYDDQTGTITTQEPVLLTSGNELLQQSEESEVLAEMQKINKLLSNLNLVKVKQEVS